ncbi:dihydrodipicolinate synthase family protein [Planococcus sp. APC 4015]|nr:dihydrodipicolinate synthase family protein [Planococcus sp. APC 4015]
MTALHGAWPVMLTPFGADGGVDHDAVGRYAQWLIDSGATGLFPVALSGEMYELSLDERLAAVRTVVSATGGRVPVAAVALGDEGPLASEVADLTAAGADIVVLVVSSVLSETDDERVLHDAVATIIDHNPDAALGLYECPLPHHRLLSTDAFARLAATGRFVFLKETSHDVQRMAERVRAGAPHGLRVFNAGIENYAESLQVGVAGLSGWVVNVAPDLVARIGDLVADGQLVEASALQSRLEAVEKKMGSTYPSSAKAIVDARAGVGLGLASRWRPAEVDPAQVADLAARLDALA